LMVNLGNSLRRGGGQGGFKSKISSGFYCLRAKF
jgi:hypothetical protein